MTRPTYQKNWLVQYATGYHPGPVAPPRTDGASFLVDKPDHGQVRIFDGEVEALVPNRVEAVVADRLGLELGVVVVCATNLDLYERGHDAAAGLTAQVPVVTIRP